MSGDATTSVCSALQWVTAIAQSAAHTPEPQTQSNPTPQLIRPDPTTLLGAAAITCALRAARKPGHWHNRTGTAAGVPRKSGGCSSPDSRACPAREGTVSLALSAPPPHSKHRMRVPIGGVQLAPVGTRRSCTPGSACRSDGSARRCPPAGARGGERLEPHRSQHGTRLAHSKNITSDRH